MITEIWNQRPMTHTAIKSIDIGRLFCESTNIPQFEKYQSSFRHNGHIVQCSHNQIKGTNHNICTEVSSNNIYASALHILTSKFESRWSYSSSDCQWLTTGHISHVIFVYISLFYVMYWSNLNGSAVQTVRLSIDESKMTFFNWITFFP